MAIMAIPTARVVARGCPRLAAGWRSLARCGCPMAFCTACGGQLESPDAHFCTHCGHSVAPPTNSATPVVVRAASVVAAPPPTAVVRAVSVVAAPPPTAVNVGSALNVGSRVTFYKSNANIPDGTVMTIVQLLGDRARCAVPNGTTKTIKIAKLVAVKDDATHHDVKVKGANKCIVCLRVMCVMIFPCFLPCFLMGGGGMIS